MDFTIQEFKELGLSPNEYIILYSLVYEDLELQSYLNTLISSAPFHACLIMLQKAGYIKINEDRSWTPRQKLLSLQTKINPEPEFEEFWKGYHEYAKQFNPSFRATDKTAGEKHWKKLNKAEKNLAFDNYKKFIDSTCTTMSARYIKKAYTFLRDKNFNDEFEIVETKRSLNKMI